VRSKKVSSSTDRNDSWPDARNAQIGGTLLPVANQMADSESGTPIFYLRLIVTIALQSRRYSRVTDRQRVSLL